jgi:uncharacterized protein (DUF1697 family)
MAKKTPPEKYVALLRGINVSGKNMLPMKALAEIFQSAGCEAVRTYIQSGNVLFAAEAKFAADVPALISGRIEAEFGYRVPVVLRSQAELSAAIAANPFFGPEVDPKALHVYFLAETPTPGAVATLDPDRSPPDRFAVVGREVHLHLPNGMGRTKLTNAWLDAKLKTLSTARNWNTVLELRDLMNDLAKL